jgi:hypothetical protein
VARVAGLLAIAVFGVVLARTFEARVTPALDHLGLSQSARSDVDRELPKMAGAEVAQPGVRAIIDEGFVFAFRLVLIAAAGLGLAAAGFGNAIRQDVTDDRR